MSHKNVWYLHYGIDSSAVSFPHRSESRLAPNVPEFDSDVPFSYLPHVKSNCRDHVFTELARLYEKNKENVLNDSLTTSDRCLITAITLTKVVFPEYCRPTSVSSISSFQKRLLNQSKIRLIKANILVELVEQ